MTTLFDAEQPWYEQRLHAVENRIRERLGKLSRRLADADWLDGGFISSDLLMVTVLRWLDGFGLLSEYSNLVTDVARSEARPAFERAFAAQLEVFEGINFKPKHCPSEA